VRIQAISATAPKNFEPTDRDLLKQILSQVSRREYAASLVLTGQPEGGVGDIGGSEFPNDERG
jgi:hypothetical protein